LKKVINTPNAPASIGTYSQAIEVNNLIFTSGQVGIDPAKGKLVTGGIEAEARQVLKNIHLILIDAGLNKDNIIKLTVFLTDLNQFSIINETFKAFFGGTDFPARSTVEVSKLPLGALVEIECIASR
tara:strand:- start:177 stop:557 length:381 start_codon:yes stop_codon:yes gene_type:complete